MIALFYTRLSEGKVRCDLCPHHCILKEGQYGICRVRFNRGGELETENYGMLSAVHLDPIEKKPLYHYFPGTEILSLGSVGCNLHCIFCQNSDISQTGANNNPWLKDYQVENIIDMAKQDSRTSGIAFTYNEPVVFYEFMKDVAVESRILNMKNVMVSNGYIDEKPLLKLLPLMDAFNIDLKAFTDDFYKKYTHSHLEPVLQTLLTIRNSGKHLEITNLLVPGLNDDEKHFRFMIDWIAEMLGSNTILHLSRYFPHHRSLHPETSSDLLLHFRKIAREKLHYVYLGNVNIDEGAYTYCANCNQLAIKRIGYHTAIVNLDEKGCCKSCGTAVALMQ